MDCLTKVGIKQEDDEFAPYTGGLVIKIRDAGRNCIQESDGTRVMMAIVMEIVGLISLPFILLEIFFISLVTALVLAGEAIKYTCDNDMANFDEKAKEVGEYLHTYVTTGLILGLGAAIICCP